MPQIPDNSEFKQKFEPDPLPLKSDMIEFNQEFKPDPVPITQPVLPISKPKLIQPVLPVPNLEDDSSKYFGVSKTLRTPAHQKMVFKFVRDQFPKARFSRIYDATTDGWDSDDFHR